MKRPEFAAHTGVGTSALAKWLAGKLIPKSEQLHSLARAAGVTMEWLLTGEEPKHPVFALQKDGFFLAYFSFVGPSSEGGDEHAENDSGKALLRRSGMAKFEFLPPDHPGAISWAEQHRFHELYTKASDEEKRSMLSLGKGSEKFFTSRVLNTFGIVMKRHLETTR